MGRLVGGFYYSRVLPAPFSHTQYHVYAQCVDIWKSIENISNIYYMYTSFSPEVFTVSPMLITISFLINGIFIYSSVYISLFLFFPSCCNLLNWHKYYIVLSIVELYVISNVIYDNFSSCFICLLFILLTRPPG